MTLKEHMHSVCRIFLIISRPFFTPKIVEKKWELAGFDPSTSMFGNLFVKLAATTVIVYRQL